MATYHCQTAGTLTV